MSRNVGSWTTISCILANFLLHMRRNGQNSTSEQILTPNLKSPLAVSYLNTNFGGAFAKIYTCFERKTAFMMQNFQNMGAGEGWGDHFFDETPKRHILG